MTESLIMLARYPRAGDGKRRLAAEIGAEAARDLYAAFVGDLIERFPHAVVAVSPAESEPDFRRIFGVHRTIPQSNGDLGNRIERAACEGLRTAARVCVIGSDLPHLPPQVAAEAFQALESVDVAIGPARDGGYYLLALSREAPALFRGIDWGTGRVLEQTLERTRAAKLSVRTLRPMIDIDTAEDLADACDEILAAPLPRTHAALRELMRARPALFQGGDL
jgi:rSAM/selenodomain-associated transferase 1